MKSGNFGKLFFAVLFALLHLGAAAFFLRPKAPPQPEAKQTTTQTQTVRIKRLEIGPLPKGREFMAIYNVTGAGDNSFNGLYTVTGSNNGFDLHSNGSRFLENGGDGLWYFTTIQGYFGSPSVAYYNNSLTGAYSNIGPQGTAPNPTVTEVTESSSSGGASSGGASSGGATSNNEELCPCEFQEGYPVPVDGVTGVEVPYEAHETGPVNPSLQYWELYRIDGQGPPCVLTKVAEGASNSGDGGCFCVVPGGSNSVVFDEPIIPGQFFFLLMRAGAGQDASACLKSVAGGSSSGGESSGGGGTSSGAGGSSGGGGTSGGGATSGGSGEPCCPPGTIWDEGAGDCVPGVPVISAPDTPLPPVLISKANGLIEVGSPAWVESATKPTQKVELLRDELTVGLATVGTLWTEEGGEYADNAVAPLFTYNYRVRAGNSAGWSLWSAPLTVALISSTCVVVITEPLEGAVLYGSRVFQFTATDEEGYTSPAWDANGLPQDAPSLVAGDEFAGVLRSLWDTPRFLQGAVNLRALAVGSDGLFAFDERSVSLANTPENAINFADIGPLSSTRLDRVFRKVHIGIETPGVSSLARFQHWAIFGLRAWLEGAVDPYPNPPLTAEEAKTQFAGHQAVSIGRGVMYPGEDYPGANERRSYYEVAKLTTAAPKGAHHVMLRVRLEERELALAWKLAPSTKLVKAREAEEVDGQSAGVDILGIETASVWRFDGETVTLLKDLSLVGCGDATDAAVWADKIFCIKPKIASRELWAVDTTPGETPFRLVPALADGSAEGREPLLVERWGGGVVVVCVDPDLTPASRAYKVTGGTSGTNLAPLWDIPGAVSLADVTPPGAGGGALALAVGAQLWRVTAGNAPALVHTFPATITALSRNLIGCSNGKVYTHNGSAWIEALTVTLGGIPTAPKAAGEWKAGAPSLRGVVAGLASAQLFEQSLDLLSWGVGRLVTNPADTPDTIEAVLALRRFVTVSGEEGEETEEERLLVLTGNDGLLVALRLSDLSEATGAVLISELATIDLAPGGAKTPFED